MKLPSGRGRSVLIVATILVAVVWFAVWYVTSTPGATHRGPLPPLDAQGRALAGNLKAHVTGVASEEHNVAHPEALGRWARSGRTTTPRASRHSSSSRAP